MPIPQFKSKSSFKKRRIGDSQPSFSYHKVSDFSSKKKKKINIFKRKKSGNSSGGWFKNLFKKLWPYALAVFLMGGIFVIGLFAYYSKDLPEPGKIMERNIAFNAKIYDRTGEVLLYEVHGEENRTWVPIEEVPEHVKQSTIAIEDKNFYNHQGISIWGILRSQIVPRLQGKRAQGGSTLTQQFVKNAILTDERKLSRKIKEWILSYQLENKFNKDQILEFYFNEIPYGGAVYGVEAAANYYFDKSASELTIAESAILAALPQAPTLYSPYGSNKDLLIGRQQYILDLMVNQGYITAEQAEQAKNQELVFKKRFEQIKAPHFVMYVRQILEEKYGPAVVEQSGWQITTSLDWEAQQKAETIVAEIGEKNQENYNASNAALISLDAQNSQILAMVGSRDYFNDEIDGQVNVTLSSRQPGSSMKPLVYLKAFERGYRPETILFDLVTNFSASGQPYIPHNYDLGERGPVSIRKALAGSLNIPAVKTLYLAGVNNVLDLANDFGYTTLKDRDRYGLSLVLGGGEVKLLDHANAYAVFAREGIYKEPVSILEIKDPEGNIVEENQENEGRRVIDKEYVRMLNSILSDNDSRAYTFGAQNSLTLPDRPVATKTGTTNNYKDAWTIGFTPDVVTGVWVGNNNNTEMKRGAGGSTVAAPIWQSFMREVTKDDEVKGFAGYELDDCSKPMICGNASDSDPVKIDTMSGKLATEYTPYTTIEEKQFLEMHTILHYVNVNDPLGDIPKNPNDDPQYSLWEGPVIAWAQEQEYTNQKPPTEEDDIHLPELRPDLSWISPSNGQTINTVNMSLRVDTSAPRGVSRVEYFLDGEKIGTSYSGPDFEYNYQINPFIKNGNHELKAIAFDDLDNFKEESLSVNIQLESDQRSFNVVWLSPENGQTINTGDFPVSLQISVDNPEKIKKIDFYYLDPDNNSKWFAYLDSPSSQINVNWASPADPGVYKLYMLVKDQADNLLTTPSIIVNIE